MNRTEILQQAEGLVNGERDATYGDPRTNMTNIAKLWSVYLGFEVRPDQVPVMNTLQKIARLIQSPQHLDSYVDPCGYMAIAGEIAGAK